MHSLPVVVPPLDPGFVPASLWNRAFQKRCRETASQPVGLALERSDGTISRFDTYILADDSGANALNRRYLERMVKALLWARGGYRLIVGGPREYAKYLSEQYRPGGERAFDFEFMGQRAYGRDLTIESCDFADLPAAKEEGSPLGRHLDGCRIGFDLGGSDRKCAAVIDGKCVYSEEIPWDPYFQSDPQYHYDGIQDSLRRAAAHLPRVDAIGGSSAGVYVRNEVRVASLFRGVPADVFEKRVRRMFFDLREAWGNIPFEVLNDGEVTALAGSMSLNAHGVLGVSMGTSTAAGYVTPAGRITPWLNELAFVPIDLREQNAPIDEWSGDGGCAVQYFSQQGVARLARVAGIDFPEEVKFAERLVEVQKLMEAGDLRARSIYETIGVYFGYAIAHWADLYDFRHLLVLGRVTTGPGGNLILDKAREVLRAEFPELYARLTLQMPDEKDKRHGQAVAAASLPALNGDSTEPARKAA